MDGETSVVNIFNRMSYDKREPEKTDVEELKDMYYPDWKDEDINQSIRTAVDTVIRTAKETQNENDGRPSKATLHLRALILQDIARELSEEANRLSELPGFRKNYYSLFTDSFNYYSNMCYQLERNWTPYDYVLLFLSSDVPFSILGSAIAAAFAAGCRVIITCSDIPWFLMFLKKVFSRTTLPKSFFTLVRLCPENDSQLDEIPPGKIVFLDKLITYETNEFSSFSFVRPNKNYSTATIIFEYCDLSAAIDKIIQETWDNKLTTMWKVSTAVVQESIYEKFMDGLELRIDQLIDEEERFSIKNFIISEEDQNKKLPFAPDVPVLKVLSCRTANEGANFLNSNKYYLGISIWSENSSQALEVASKLICKNVWINCHGITEPSVPFQPPSGIGVFGGYEGILEYATIPFSATMKTSEFKATKIQTEETVLSAQKAFEKWLSMENREMYLSKVAQSLKNHTELFYVSDLIIEVLSTGNRNPLPKSCNKNFYVIHEKFPIGVIAILTEDFDSIPLVYLITTAVAFGNAVILTLREGKKNSKLVELVDIFNIHLPRGLLSVITEEEESRAGISLACNTVVQALWLYPVTSFPTGYIELIRKILRDFPKRIWLIPDLSHHYRSYSFIYQRECLTNKIIWLTKVDHFP